MAGVFVFGATIGVVAKTQRIGIEQEGIVQTVKCPHPEVLDRDVKVMLVRFPTSKNPDRSGVDTAKINEFFRQLSDKYPDGYQIDVITAFRAAPKATRAGVLNVSGMGKSIDFDYVRKTRGIKSFRARISEVGIESLDLEPTTGVDTFIRSFFDENGCEKDHILVDPVSPYRLYIERVHSLKEYGFDGERIPVSVK